MARILVVDDEPSVCGLISEILTKNGETVKTAPNGKLALKLFESNAYDIVVTDMCLPDIDGPAIVKHIRKSTRSVTPVIGISGTPWMLEGSGCDVVLSKPFNMLELVKKVNDLKS
jgi:DNA-binding response OmpR family regulator